MFATHTGYSSPPLQNYLQQIKNPCVYKGEVWGFGIFITCSVWLYYANPLVCLDYLTQRTLSRDIIYFSTVPYLRGKSSLMRDIFFNNFIKNPGILCTNSLMSSLDIPIFSWHFGQYPTQYAQALYPLLSSIYMLPSFAGLPFFVCILFYN